MYFTPPSRGSGACTHLINLNLIEWRYPPALSTVASEPRTRNATTPLDIFPVAFVRQSCGDAAKLVGVDPKTVRNDLAGENSPPDDENDSFPKGHNNPPGENSPPA